MEQNLAKNGLTKYLILVAQNALPVEKYAARELSNFLTEITGAAFMLSYEQGSAEKVIAVGPDAAKEIGVTLMNNLKPDSLVLTTQGENIAIYGGRPRGTLYGVYEFLDQLGCRWFTSTVSHIPKIPELSIPSPDKQYTPILEFREPFYADTFDARFAARIRSNGAWSKLTPELGGKIKYAKGHNVHTFNGLIPVKKYFDEHPEYFSMIDGKRISEQTQLCLTNPDVFRIVVEKAREWLTSSEGANIISISQNDWYNPCECPECKKIDDEAGAHSGTLIWFVNRVAETLEPEFPDVVFDTLAYQYTRQAPKGIKPRHNVCVRLCSIECCFAHPLSECEEISDRYKKENGSAKSFQEDLRDWAKISDRLYIWDYVTNFTHYCMPFPNFHVLAPNIRFMVENSVRGIFEQGNSYPGGGADLNELRTYLISRLLWNPYCDIESEKKLFLDEYYGEASAAVAEYIDLMKNAVDVPDKHMGIYEPTTFHYLNDAVLTKAEAILSGPEDKLLDDIPRLVRLKRAQLPLKYVRVAQALSPDSIDKTTIDILFDLCKTAGITRLSEWRTMTEEYALMTEKGVTRII